MQYHYCITRMKDDNVSFDIFNLETILSKNVQGRNIPQVPAYFRNFKNLH